jgi:hypothetical protein
VDERCRDLVEGHPDLLGDRYPSRPSSRLSGTDNGESLPSLSPHKKELRQRSFDLRWIFMAGKIGLFGFNGRSRFRIGSANTNGMKAELVFSGNPRPRMFI